MPTYGSAATNSFQVWIQLGETEGITYTYGGVDLGAGATIGAENRDGTSGVEVEPGPDQPADEWRVTTTPPTPGGSVTFDYTLKGILWGTWSTWVQLKSDALRATPMEQTRITVK